MSTRVGLSLSPNERKLLGMSESSSASDPASMFASPEWYDRTINWTARLERELPVLKEVFGPPAAGGILDAGCGTGRQAIALALEGYRVTGADGSDDMLRFAKQKAAAEHAQVRFLPARYEGFRTAGLDGFDGVYCIGNSLAAAGSGAGAAAAIEQFAAVLRPGGRLFVQILNFGPMRRTLPCVQGPRVSKVDGRAYVSVRQFHFTEAHSGECTTGEARVAVTNITIWDDGGWRQRSHMGWLYPLEVDEFRRNCERAGLTIDQLWGGYSREPFDAEKSIDLIVVATREGKVVEKRSHSKDVAE